MSNSRTILVSGATGDQGGSVARHLLRRRHHVRALTRDPSAEAARALADLGAEVVPGDFDDPISLRNAATGMDAVFAMGTPFGTDPATETRQSIALIEAARQVGVGHVLYSSVASALEDTGIPHFESKAEVEEHLRAVAVPHTVIAPVAFVTDLTSPDVVQSLQQGHYPSVVTGDRTLQQIHLADLGAFAALVLEQPERFAGQRIELASFEISTDDLAQRLSRVLGRRIEEQEIPLEVIRQMGGEDFVRMAQFFRTGGYSVDIAHLRQRYPEVDWTDPEEWISRHDWASTGLLEAHGSPN